ncbi:hypothetical protein NMG60_11030963 [Bertholletia excelsa]
MDILDFHHPLGFIFGVLGNIVSIFVYVAPLLTFREIYRNKSTLGFGSLPYVAGLFSAVLWLYYAFLASYAVLLISINSFGCIIETFYLAIYLAYASKEARNHTAKLVGSLTVGVFSVVLITQLCVEDSSRATVVGWICVAISVSVYAAPLSVMVKVVGTRSVEFMPFFLSFSLTLNAVIWFIHGLQQMDLCILAPNVIGFFLGATQMVMYGVHRNAKKTEKHPEHMIDIVTMGRAEVHPLDSQTSGSKIDGVEED